MITVFTPVYNRKKEIIKLFESLNRQTVKHFEWVIVDDGSEDGVCEVINKLIENTTCFTIKYYYQKNSGKHVAINKGVQMASGEYFFIVDSDDYLVDDAIERIEYNFRDVPKSYAGIGMQRITPNGETIGRTFKGDYVDCTTAERPKYHINGDKAEVFFTEIIRRYPFPVFEGEKFLSEACVWYKMSADGLKIRWINEPAVVCEYLPGGLSDRSVDLAISNFKGTTHKVEVMLRCKLPIETRTKTIGNYIYIGRRLNYSIKQMSEMINVSIVECIASYSLCLLKKIIRTKFNH